MKRYKANINYAPTVVLSATTVVVLWMAGAKGYSWFMVIVPALAVHIFAKYIEYKMNHEQEA